MSDAKAVSGAVRSSDADHLDFTSLPLIGLIAVARTASEGATKYGRYNYMKGFSVHELLNHCIRHILMHVLGDRSEPHLSHAGWGILDAIQADILDPELSAPHMLGPGATLTPANIAHLAEQEAVLKPKRDAGEFDDIGDWQLRDLDEIKTILGQRWGVKLGIPYRPRKTKPEPQVWADGQPLAWDEDPEITRRPAPGYTSQRPETRTPGHVPVEWNSNHDASSSALRYVGRYVDGSTRRHEAIRDDMNRCLEAGKITAEEYSQWVHNGTLPKLFYGK